MNTLLQSLGLKCADLGKWKVMERCCKSDGLHIVSQARV
jgi:hypothetical protein